MKVVKDKGVEGKVIVCTGAAGVLCSSMTEDLLKHGAKVAVLDLRKDVADKFVASLAKKGLKQCIAVEANVLDKASLEAACKVVLKKWKRIDVLINGAGGNHPKGTTPAEQMTKGVKLEDTFFGLQPEGFEFVNKLNLIGTILPCQVPCKEMPKPGGAVLHFCSTGRSRRSTTPTPVSRTRTATIISSRASRSCPARRPPRRWPTT